MIGVVDCGGHTLGECFTHGIYSGVNSVTDIILQMTLNRFKKSFIICMKICERKPQFDVGLPDIEGRK